jgi:hypothetical protein
MTKRIKLPQVRKAYKATGLPLGRYTYWECQDNSACPMGAIYIHKYGIPDSESDIPDGLKDMGYTTDYQRGFWEGFDTASQYFNHPNDSADFNFGFKDGIRIRKALLNF